MFRHLFHPFNQFSLKCVYKPPFFWFSLLRKDNFGIAIVLFRTSSQSFPPLHTGVILRRLARCEFWGEQLCTSCQNPALIIGKDRWYCVECTSQNPRANQHCERQKRLRQGKKMNKCNCLFSLTAEITRVGTNLKISNCFFLSLSFLYSFVSISVGSYLYRNLFICKYLSISSCFFSFVCKYRHMTKILGCL